jgi:hypothetical protein
MSEQIDIEIDWNEEDDTGLPWTLLRRAPAPEKIVPGARVVAGRPGSLALAEVVDVDADGVVHLRLVPAADVNVGSS